MRQEPMTPTTCDRCGEAFNTSAVHPRRYCSIGCEEGRTPLPMSDPASEGYHLHLQANPEDLIGCALVVSTVKRTDYSPDWHRDPSEYPRRVIREIDEENTILIYEGETFLGRVVDMVDGDYIVSVEWEEHGHRHLTIPVSDTVNQIRRGDWWAEQ